MPGNTAAPARGASHEAIAAKLGLSGPQYMTGTRQFAASRARALRQLLAQIDLDEAMRRRSVQQAITEATADYWRHRAEDFQQVGNQECDLIALACLRKAAFMEWEAGQPLIDPGEAA
jgi:hypothetical protein